MRNMQSPTPAVHDDRTPPRDPWGACPGGGWGRPCEMNGGLVVPAPSGRAVRGGARCLGCVAIDGLKIMIMTIDFCKEECLEPVPTIMSTYLLAKTSSVHEIDWQTLPNSLISDNTHCQLRYVRELQKNKKSRILAFRWRQLRPFWEATLFCRHFTEHWEMEWSGKTVNPDLLWNRLSMDTQRFTTSFGFF